jgi:hypothetical protein
VPDSPLAQTADLALVTLAGRERAVPATKKFTTQLVAMAVLATALARDPLALALVVAGQLVLWTWPGRSVCTPTHPRAQQGHPDRRQSSITAVTRLGPFSEQLNVVGVGSGHFSKGPIRTSVRGLSTERRKKWRW